MEMLWLKMLKRFLPHFVKSNPWVWIVILSGALNWSLTMVKSGMVFSYGMGFWGPNGHDGVWHIALINSLLRGSLEMPVFAGEGIRNYHIGFDLILAGISKVTRISSYNLYFQVLPPFTAVLIGLFTYRFVSQWRRSRTQALFATFFVFFGGSFGWLITLFRTWEVAGESLFWSQQAISSLLNPPFAVSLLLLILLCIFLGRYEGGFAKPGLGKLKLGVFLVVVLALMPQIKVYGGVLVFLGFGVLGVLGLFRKRFNYLVIFLLSVLLSAVLFFPLNKNASSLVVFQPFWFLETMMAVSDRFYWPKFYQAMVTYRMADIWYKAIPSYGVAFLIFIVGNLGTRLLGFWEIIKRRRGLGVVDIFLLTIAGFGVLLPMLFLQKGTPWNTIQFFYYSLFVFSIYTGIFVGKLWEGKGNYGKVIAFFLLVMTLPTSYSTLRHYLPSRPPAKIPLEELEALEFLKKQPKGVVLTYPFDRKAAEEAVASPPRPLYLYESTAYVSAFSQKSVFLEDEVNLDIMGYDWKTRRQEVLDWLGTLNEQKAYDFLREKNISYIYWVGKQRARVGEGQWGGVRIFQNGEVEIYKVN